MDRTNELIELRNKLAEPFGFDPERIWIGINSYNEYEIEIDEELWSNCYSFDEAEEFLENFFKGFEVCFEQCVSKLEDAINLMKASCIL